MRFCEGITHVFVIRDGVATGSEIFQNGADFACQEFRGPGRERSKTFSLFLEVLLCPFEECFFFFVRQEKVGRGQDRARISSLFRFLALDIKKLYVFDFVVEEFDADRVEFRDGIDVEDVATRGELEGMLDFADRLIPHFDEGALELPKVDDVADAKREGTFPKHLGIRQEAQKGAWMGHENFRMAFLLQQAQGIKALGQ